MDTLNLIKIIYLRFGFIFNIFIPLPIQKTIILFTACPTPRHRRPGQHEVFTLIQVHRPTSESVLFQPRTTRSIFMVTDRGWSTIHYPQLTRSLLKTFACISSNAPSNKSPHFWFYTNGPYVLQHFFLQNRLRSYYGSWNPFKDTALGVFRLS